MEFVLFATVQNSKGIPEQMREWELALSDLVLPVAIHSLGAHNEFNERNRSPLRVTPEPVARVGLHQLPGPSASTSIQFTELSAPHPTLSITPHSHPYHLPPPSASSARCRRPGVQGDGPAASLGLGVEAGGWS